MHSLLQSTTYLYFSNGQLHCIHHLDYHFLIVLMFNNHLYSVTRVLLYATSTLLVERYANHFNGNYAWDEVNYTYHVTR